MSIEGRLSVGMLADALEGWQALYRLADGLYASLPESERRCIEAGGLTDPTEALRSQIAPILARMHPHVRAEIAGTLGSAVTALRAFEAEADGLPPVTEGARCDGRASDIAATAQALQRSRESLDDFRQSTAVLRECAVRLRQLGGNAS